MRTQKRTLRIVGPVGHACSTKRLLGIIVSTPFASRIVEERMPIRSRCRF